MFTYRVTSELDWTVLLSLFNIVFKNCWLLDWITLQNETIQAIQFCSKLQIKIAINLSCVSIWEMSKPRLPVQISKCSRLLFIKWTTYFTCEVLNRDLSDRAAEFSGNCRLQSLEYIHSQSLCNTSPNYLPWHTRVKDHHISTLITSQPLTRRENKAVIRQCPWFFILKCKKVKNS